MVVLSILLRKESIAIDRKTLIVMGTHSGIGENGTVQAYLEAFGYPHTHSAAWTCALLTHKHAAKLIYQALGIPTPPWYYNGIHSTNFKRGDRNIIRKPVRGGIKKTISLWLNQPQKEVGYMYEEYIPGNIEISVSVLGNKDKKVLSPIVRKRSIENLGILKPSENQVPAKVLDACKKAALLIHATLQCYGITKTDFVLDEQNRFFALETDVHPGLAKSRASATAALRSGISYEQLITSIVKETAI
jgi:D-alanine-D-alanine ligase